MPVIPPDVLETAREIYNDLIHNTVTSVKKVSSTETTSENPLFAAQKHATSETIYTNFQCSIYDMLSGKVDRLFGDKTVHELISELGIVDKTAIAVRYVPNGELDTGVLNNLEPADEVLHNGEWWRVSTVVPDSEGLQHTAICTK